MLIKSTANYCFSEIEALVKFAAAQSLADLSSVHVNVKNCKSGAIAGMAYEGVPAMSNAPASAKYLVSLRIGRESKFPADNMRWRWGWVKPRGNATRGHYKRVYTHPYGGKSSPLLKFENWEEGMVALAAHEFHHIYQFQNNLPRSEVEAEKAAEKALLAFRGR